MVQMEIVEDKISVRSNGTSSIPEFSKKEEIKYCYICGKECFSDSILCCGKGNFMAKEVSEIVGGYIELAKNDKLKAYYYKTRYSKSIVKMNPKRMIHQMLIHKNNVNINKDIVDKIYSANI